MAAYPKPLPEITPESRPFWDGCRRHEYLVQRCQRCGERQHYPRGVCASCWSADLEWQRSAGRGRIYTFTVVHRTQARGFKDELPYVLAWVDLDEGVQVLTNIVGADPGALRIGVAVRVVFDDVNEAISIPRFTLAAQ